MGDNLERFCISFFDVYCMHPVFSVQSIGLDIFMVEIFLRSCDCISDIICILRRYTDMDGLKCVRVIVHAQCSTKFITVQ